MRKQTHFSLLSNHCGVAMITVLLVMLVLAILATGVVVIAVSNYNQTATTDKHTQAYYVAEAGINYQVGRFETTVNILVLVDKSPIAVIEGIDDWIENEGEAQQTLATVKGLERSFTASLSRDSYAINIMSTGTVGGISRTLTKRISLNGLLINKSILASEELNINKTDVFLDESGNAGEVQVLSNDSDSVNIDKLGQISEISIPTPIPPMTFVDIINGCTAVGPISDQICQTGAYTYKVIYDDSITVLPPVVIPTQPTVAVTDLLSPVQIVGKTKALVDTTGIVTISSNSVNTGSSYTLASSNSPKVNFYVPKFEVIGTVSNFTIDIGDKDIVILTDNLTLSGSFKIQGTGSLTIFVTSANFHYSCGNGSICGVPGNVTPTVSDQFIVVITGPTGTTLDLSNNTGDFYMSLITNLNVNLSMLGNRTFNGFLATSGNDISFKGTAGSNMLLYAPNALVNITGNASLSGSIICRSYQNLNSASTDVTYDPAFSNPPFDFLNPFSNMIYEATVEQ
ncbi:MAG: hypothetical protein E4G74_01965 [Erysipelotrichales bacterium]|nr:MAG: hypothetical protein E4G74_01965 [Erysipelotrichales bacterium]